MADLAAIGIVAGIFLIVLLIISFIFFKRLFSTLILDYGADCLLSFLDYALGGIGAVGIDVGDWLGAYIIYNSEKKISGSFPAFLAAWEATNFLPLSFIPIVGEGIEIATNLFPAVTIIRSHFSKEEKAEKNAHEIEESMNFAKRYSITLWGMREKNDQLGDLMKKNNYVEAFRISERLKKELAEKFKYKLSSMRANFQAGVGKVKRYRRECPPEMIGILGGVISQGERYIEESKALESSGEIREAIGKIEEAQGVLKQGIKGFNARLREFQRSVEAQADGQITSEIDTILDDQPVQEEALAAQSDDLVIAAQAGSSAIAARSEVTASERKAKEEIKTEALGEGIAESSVEELSKDAIASILGEDREDADKGSGSPQRFDQKRFYEHIKQAYKDSGADIHDLLPKAAKYSVDSAVRWIKENPGMEQEMFESFTAKNDESTKLAIALVLDVKHGIKLQHELDLSRLKPEEVNMTPSFMNDPEIRAGYHP